MTEVYEVQDDELVDRIEYSVVLQLEEKTEPQIYMSDFRIGKIRVILKNGHSSDSAWCDYERTLYFHDGELKQVAPGPMELIENSDLYQRIKG